MIVAKDLRIGNLVWELNEETKEPFEIKGIQKLSNKDYLMDSNGDWCGLEFYLPIPLTEDWLIRMGFEEKHSGYRINISKGIFLYLRNYKNNWICNISYGDYVHQKVNLINCENIHSVQNLYYSLYGEELKIKE